MAEPPVIDGRRREAIREHVTDIAPYYTEAWDPTTPGPGTALVSLFAEMAADVVERLDRVPEKHRMAFYDALGFDRRPPEPARLPLSVTVAEGASQNVAVEGNTRAVAPAIDGRPEQSFTVPDSQRFEATPARLRAVYGVDPATDRICDHWQPGSASALSGDGAQWLFAEADRQSHALYVAHTDQLHVTPPDEGTATVRVSVPTDTTGDVLSELVWAFYGEAPVDGETVETWHEFETARVVDGDGSADEVALDLSVEGTLTETTVDGVESRWIRASPSRDVGIEAVTDVRVGAEIAVGPGPLEQETAGGTESDDTGERGPTKEMSPDSLLYNDVPLPYGPVGGSYAAASGENEDSSSEESGGESPVYYPLGNAPQKQDSFYVAAQEAFTKTGARVRLTFDGLQVDPSVPEDEDGGGVLPGPAALARLVVLQQFEPRLSWEYWDGDGWSRLEDVQDETVALTGPPAEDEQPTVTFPVPDDLAETSVAGHENYWIRCRLVGGGYGRWQAHETDGQWENRQFVHPPMFEDLTVSYVVPPPDDGEPADGGDGHPLPLATATHVLAENHLSFSENAVGSDAEHVRPFRRLAEDVQTLYLGFDRRLHGGPITLFFDVEDTAFPEGFHTRVRWEYAVDDEWVELDVQDGTEGLTERGIVRLVFPTETEPRSLFGQNGHWLRARLTGDQFDTDALRHFTLDALRAFRRSYRPVFDLVETESVWDGFGAALFRDRHVTTDLLENHWVDLYVQAALYASGFQERLRTDHRLQEPFDELAGIDRVGTGDADTGNAGTEDDCSCEPADPCGRTIETEPPAGEPTTVPPVATELAQNAAWASNVLEVDRETLGSSDGEPGESFTARDPPVLSETVWVDELAALSEGERRALREAETPAVETETRHDGTLAAFWVAWRGVPDLLDSGEADRHYTVDRTAGTVSFGDGTRGRVPPQGADNVEMSYRTGGGPEGNVARGAVTDLASSIRFVDGVANPAAGAGGAPAESSEAVLDRAPGELRDRGRAVAASDYERIASDAARGIARARCVPEMNRGGDHEPGWVTLLVVPDSGQPRPTPSTGLRSRVRSAVAERAPATLVAADRLVVRGPSYVATSVDVDVVAAGTAGVATLEEDVAGAVGAFLHPLTGGDGGDGWAFGELPTMSDLYAVVEGVDGVDHVASLRITVQPAEDAATGSEGSATVREGEESPSVSADALVTSGDHDVTVTLDTAVLAREVE